MKIFAAPTPPQLDRLMSITVPGALEVPAAIAFADAHPFKLFGLDKKPSMLLGMEGLRSFERVSVDFSTKKVTFLLPKAAAKP